MLQKKGLALQTEQIRRLIGQVASRGSHERKQTGEIRDGRARRTKVKPIILTEALDETQSVRSLNSKPSSGSFRHSDPKHFQTRNIPFQFDDCLAGTG
jgi:hypothetical protein